ncbi:MAG: ParB N-terminal domain-containing protein, partial [Thermoguttaceae bacterium]
MAKKPREETRKVDDLKPHPFAQKVLGDPPFHEIAELAEDMKKNGQRDAIDIRPDGTILNGLTRWLAAKMAGITELRVVVHELDDTAAKKFVLESNLLRHHYSKLVIGRIYVELKKLARGRGKKAPPGEGDVRDRLAKRFGISGRTLDNLEAMLDAPVEVQAVYQEGDLPDGVILAVAKLSADLKKELVATLKTGDIDKEATIKAFLAAHKSPPAVTTNTKAGTKSATKPNAKSGTKPTKASDKADNKVNGKKHEDAAPTTQA